MCARRHARRGRPGDRVAGARLLHGADGDRERRAGRRDFAAGAVRAGDVPLSRQRFDEAVHLANRTNYGLTGAIHTASLHRAQEFITRYRGGLVSVNGATFGAGPHMPFGGVKNSGNGFREPGTEVARCLHRAEDGRDQPQSRARSAHGPSLSIDANCRAQATRSASRSPIGPTTAAASC